MRMSYARALCEDFIHIEIPEDENCICFIRFPAPREVSDVRCNAMIDRELAIALKTLISGKEE